VSFYYKIQQGPGTFILKSFDFSFTGYMNCGGILQVARFEKFLAALAEKEMDRFEDIYSDAKWLEGKTAKKVYEGGPKIVTDTPGPANVEEMLCPSSGHASATTDDWEIVSHNKNKKDGDLMRLLQSADDFLLDSSEGPTESDSLCGALLLLLLL
jgi:hypothetical protein